MIIYKIFEKISSIILENGIDFFEIKTFDKVNNTKIEILFDIVNISPKYTNQ